MTEPAVFAVTLMLGALTGALGLMLVLSALSKWRNFAEWQSSLAAYRLVPDSAFGAAAAVIPVAELLAGGGLLAALAGAPQWLAVLAAAGGAGLMLLYAAGMAINLRRGRSHIDCGCNPGGKPQSISAALVMRNCALAAGFGLAALPVRPSGLAEMALCFVAAITGLIALHTFSYLQRLGSAFSKGTIQ